MPWSLLLEGTCLLNLKPPSKKETMSSILSVIYVFGVVREFIHKQALSVIDYVRKMDGNTWIWEDGRSSCVAPTLQSDRDTCWYYNALANRLVLCVPQGTETVVRRMPWITVTLKQNNSSIDVTDYFAGLMCESPLRCNPSIMVIRTLLTQKLGIYVGNTAFFHVFCQSDLLEEKVFNADLEEENDEQEWFSSWD